MKEVDSRIQDLCEFRTRFDSCQKEVMLRKRRGEFGSLEDISYAQSRAASSEDNTSSTWSGRVGLRLNHRKEAAASW